MRYTLRGNSFFSQIQISSSLGEIRFYYVQLQQRDNQEIFNVIDKILKPSDPIIGFSHSKCDYYEIFGMTELKSSERAFYGITERIHAIQIILNKALSGNLISQKLYDQIEHYITETFNGLMQKAQKNKQFTVKTKPFLQKMQSSEQTKFKEIKRSIDLKEFSNKFVVFQSKFPEYFGDFSHPIDSDSRFAFIMPIEALDSRKNFGIFLFTRVQNQTRKTKLLPATIEHNKFRMRRATAFELAYLHEAHNFDQAYIEMHTTKNTFGLVEDLARLSLSSPEFQIQQPLLTQFYQKMHLKEDCDQNLRFEVSHSCTII